MQNLRRILFFFALCFVSFGLLAPNVFAQGNSQNRNGIPNVDSLLHDINVDSIMQHVNLDSIMARVNVDSILHKVNIDSIFKSNRGSLDNMLETFKHFNLDSLLGSLKHINVDSILKSNHILSGSS
ncbi:MAG TPA: hypothetical protein VFX22_12255, partial [Candidatus Kapabacteria bacterium]|nr:hypothetical protein [Candidatus Kapabacteria bacterium]